MGHRCVWVVVFETQAICVGLKKPGAGYQVMPRENPAYAEGPRHFHFYRPTRSTQKQFKTYNLPERGGAKIYCIDFRLGTTRSGSCPMF